MKNLFLYLIFSLFTIYNLSCHSVFRSKSHAVENFKKDTIYLNEDLKKQLNPVLKNSKRINSIKNWTIKTKSLWETAEGGEAKFYYKNGKLEKITTHYLSETFQKLTVYHLENQKLSFVFDKYYQYNRPMYYDSIAMKSNNDTEVFDFNKAEITVNRYYFLDQKLTYQLDSQDCGAPFSTDYLLETEKEIKKEFEYLMEISNHVCD
jgi:hypothetical protein